MSATPTRPRLPSWLPPLLLALVWGLGPALPALTRGELLGHPFTDLYPSVWGLWWFASQQPGLPDHTALLGFPDGMGFYYSSPIKGWLAWPLLTLLSLPATWNLLLIAARVGTVMAAWGAARAWGMGGPGALAAAALYGASPFFHGYAVEGIVEGTDGWTLALLAWALGRTRRGPSTRHLWSALAFALTLLSSWYLGMVACLVLLLAAVRDRRALWGFGGLLLVAPALWAFLGAFPGASPLPDAIRAAMGASLQIPRPGLRPGLSPFAMTAYVGWIATAAALWSRSPWLLLAAIPAALSLGIGPIYDLPGAQMVRFPYRWHAGTLLLLAPALGTLADRKGWWALGPLVALEGLLLSPVEPVIPGAPAGIPDLYAHLDGPTLVVPGPVGMPPGEINRSRPRSRYLLYFQTASGQPSPWTPDFNGMHPDAQRGSALDRLRSYDPLESPGPGVEPGSLEPLRASGLTAIIVERSELGRARARALERDLLSAGARHARDDPDRSLFLLQKAPPRSPPQPD